MLAWGEKMIQNVYQAGDILVACDNQNGLPPGFMGHSALVVDPNHIVEAVTSVPYVRVSRITEFTQDHPIHAHYRPKSMDFGAKAAACALDYWRKSEGMRMRGLIKPSFSFNHLIPLDDPWTAVYCSKLVWLAYYYGAQHAFPNDYYLFAPEDLDMVLSKDPKFELLYKHPSFRFVIDL